MFLPVLAGALTAALLTLVGGLSTPLAAAVGAVAALLALGLRIVWLRRGP